jgi:hypothetical protein
MRPLTPSDLLDARSWMRLRDRHRVAWLADARRRRLTVAPGVDLVWVNPEAARFYLQELALAASGGAPAPAPVELLDGVAPWCAGDGTLTAWAIVTDVERPPLASPPTLRDEGGAEVVGRWASPTEPATAMRAVVFDGLSGAPTAVDAGAGWVALPDALRAALRVDLADGAPLRALDGPV